MPPSANEEEEKYFLELQAEQRRLLAEKLAQEAASLAARRQLAKAAGTDDLAVAERLAALGFDERTVRVIDLLPLVYVAWADGKIQRGERVAIMRTLGERGIGHDDPAFVLLASLLDERPSPEYLGEVLAVLRDLVGSTGKVTTLVEACTAIAQAGAGFWGLGRRVEPEERAEIEKIVALLGHTADERLVSDLEGT